MAARHLILGSLLLSFSLACAQTQPPANKSASVAPAAAAVPFPIYDPETHAPLLPERMRFDILCAENLSGLTYRVFPQDKTLPPYYCPLALRARQRSNTYAFNGNETLDLFWYTNEKTPPVPALTIKLPERENACMVVLRVLPAAHASARPQLEAFTINLNKKAFPGGSYVVINLAEVPLAGTVDGELLKPIPRLTKPKRAHNGGLDVYAYIEEEKSIVNVTRSKLSLLPLYRYWICFFPGSKGGRGQAQYSLLREAVRLDTVTGEALQEKVNAQEAANTAP